MQSFPNMNILFVMHTRVTHFLEVFRDYTSARCDRFTAIDHPLHPLPGTRSKLSVYRKKKRVYHSELPRIPGPYALNFLKDFFLTIFWGIKTGIVYDMAIGANNVSALALLVLKRLGRVKHVVFMSIDYTPSRYDNPVLNWLYHWFDRICCYHVDIIWNSSGRMNEARIKNGVDSGRIARTVVMPDGSNFDPKKRLSITRIDRRKIIYCGHMRAVMGIELILETFKKLLEKVPDASLLLIGGGPELEKYKAYARALGLGKKAVFAGFLPRHEDVDNLVRTGAIGLALFAPDKSSYEYYSDVGKPKVYLAAGLPVIITRVPEIADIIEREQAGVVIGYNKEDLFNAMLLLLQSDAVYRRLRRNAIVLSRRYVWPNIFAATYKKTLKYLTHI